MTTSIAWAAEVEQTVHNLSRLIQAQTVNPPGNELPAILLVKEFLEKAGVPAEMVTIVESMPNRVNLVARLRGDGSQRPLLLSGHVDVVPVEREHWSRDPFGGEVVDGVVWGRGALDMKGFLAMYLQIFSDVVSPKNTPEKGCDPGCHCRRRGRFHPRLSIPGRKTPRFDRCRVCIDRSRWYDRAPGQDPPVSHPGGGEKCLLAAHAHPGETGAWLCPAYR